MIRAIIIDDEKHCIDRLSALLKEHCSNIHLMESFQSVKDGLEGIKKLLPDLVFLDVQIHNKTGFDLLQQLDKINFEVIFTTAYDKYAVQAFKFSAIDYLLKPVDVDDLKQAVEKLEKKISQSEAAKRFDTLFHNLQSQQGASKKICIRTVNEFTWVQVDDIIRCQSDVNYTNIVLKDKQKITVSRTLKEFEDMLTDFNFYRVHNSHLINLAFVKTYNKGGFVVMSDGSEVEVSSRRKEDFLKKLSEI